MGTYILRRLLYMIPVLLIVSVLSFIIIQLPPGDYLTTKIAQLQLERGSQASLGTSGRSREATRSSCSKQVEEPWSGSCPAGSEPGPLGTSLADRR